MQTVFRRENSVRATGQRSETAPLGAESAKRTGPVRLHASSAQTPLQRTTFSGGRPTSRHRARRTQRETRVTVPELAVNLKVRKTRSEVNVGDALS